MVRYKPKRSVDEMREEYELRAESMTMNYGKKMGAERIKERGENFAEEYSRIRWTIIEFVRGLLKTKKVTGQDAIKLQNALSEAYSAYQRLYRGSAIKYLEGVAEIVAAMRNAGILTDDECRKVREFVVTKLGIPAEDIDAFWGIYGLPT